MGEGSYIIFDYNNSTYRPRLGVGTVARLSLKHYSNTVSVARKKLT